MLINGTVKNYIGVPLGDKRVKLHYETYVDHYDRPSFNIETSTNNEGHFQFELTERVLAFSVTVYHYQERLSYSKGKVSNKQYALDFTIDEQRENIRVSEKSDNVSVYVARELSPEALESQRTGQPVPIRKADSTSIHIIKPIPYRIDEWLID